MALLRSGFAVSVVLVVAAAVSHAAATSELLPPAGAVNGWQMREAARAYTPQDLYEYIDGNADLFLSYGCVDVAVGDYAPTSGEGWISVDVYNMGTSLNAFGIFGAEKAEGVEATALGAQGYRSEGLIAFWKGQYYVKVSLIEGSDSAEAQRLAEVTNERIAAPPTMPAELARLPAEGMVAGSERYARKDALGHKFLVEAISASYRLQDAGSRGAEEPGSLWQDTRSGLAVTLHIADLGTAEKATQALMKLREFEASTGGAVAEMQGVGEGAFAVRDPYYGELVAARDRRFVAIGVSEDAKPDAVEGLVKAGIASAVKICSCMVKAPS